MPDTLLNPATIIDREATLLTNHTSLTATMPSTADLAEIMHKITTVVFYDFEPPCDFSGEHLRRILFDIYMMLGEQINLASKVRDDDGIDFKQKALTFVSNIHELRRLIFTDVQAIMHNDPAARTPHEVVASYPAIKALLHYRSAHMLHKLGVHILPRIITELAHSATGIDIHPGATIGEYFGIDHGTGVVIGETCIIGNHVTIYQGVTLGAKNFEYDDDGKPRNLPRHPIIENYVTIYSNTSVLGRVTVGHDTVIGGNVWLTHDVPPGSRVLQSDNITQPIIK